MVALLTGAPALDASPPEHSRWRLTFSDEFEGNRLDPAKWEVESGSPTHILSSRWPENLEVRDGICRLITKKEKRGEKDWTTARFWSRTFRQKYGYSSRPATATAPPGRFEIDINEGHHPGKVNMNIHNWSGQHWARHEQWISPNDLSKDFHVYGLEWNERELIWYIDGVVRRVSRNEVCHGEVPVIFSTAILRWAGEITDALDGTSMDVDYVRAYERAGPTPAAPKEISSGQYQVPLKSGRHWKA